jgi:mannitol-specific phosphotransferase system IIBC component
MNSTGAHVWNYTTGGGVYSSPAVAGGRVYVGSDDGKVYCLPMILNPSDLDPSIIATIVLIMAGAAVAVVVAMVVARKRRATASSRRPASTTKIDMKERKAEEQRERLASDKRERDAAVQRQDLVAEARIAIKQTDFA